MAIQKVTPHNLPCYPPSSETTVAQASSQATTVALLMKLFCLAHEIGPVSKLCPRCVQTLAGIFLSAKILTFALNASFCALDTRIA